MFRVHFSDIMKFSDAKWRGILQPVFASLLARGYVSTLKHNDYRFCPTKLHNSRSKYLECCFDAIPGLYVVML